MMFFRFKNIFQSGTIDCSTMQFDIFFVYHFLQKGEFMKKISILTLCALSLIISTQQTFTVDAVDAVDAVDTVVVSNTTKALQPKKGKKKDMAKCHHDTDCKSGACYMNGCAKKGSPGYKIRMKAQKKNNNDQKATA